MGERGGVRIWLSGKGWFVSILLGLDSDVKVYVLSDECLFLL